MATDSRFVLQLFSDMFFGTHSVVWLSCDGRSVQSILQGFYRHAPRCEDTAVDIGDPRFAKLVHLFS
jgi:hypothetical protein